RRRPRRGCRVRGQGRSSPGRGATTARTPRTPRLRPSPAPPRSLARSDRIMIRDRAVVKDERGKVSHSALHAADEELFRERCRSFLRSYPFDPAVDQDAPEALDDCRAYQAALFEAGLAGLTYPRKWGGRGLTSRHQQIWREESAGYPLPTRPIAISHGMCL